MGKIQECAICKAAETDVDLKTIRVCTPAQTDTDTVRTYRRAQLCKDCLLRVYAGTVKELAALYKAAAGDHRPEAYIVRPIMAQCVQSLAE